MMSCRCTAVATTFSHAWRTDIRMEWIDVLPTLLASLVCLLIGFALGSRRGRSARRRALRDLNAQSIELLDARSSLHRLENYAAQQQRRDRLLKMTLRKLQEARASTGQVEQLLEQEKRQNYTRVSRLRLDLVEAREAAERFEGIARQATAHLQRLEKASPVTQTIEAPEPKSYGTGEPVTVSVVDQARLDTPSDAVMPVSNRDSARLTRLRSSNEASAPRL